MERSNHVYVINCYSLVVVHLQKPTEENNKEDKHVKCVIANDCSVDQVYGCSSSGIRISLWRYVRHVGFREFLH